MGTGPTAEGWGLQPTRLAMSLCVSPQPASLRNCSGSMFGTMLSASSRSSLAVASLLMGTRARDGGGRQDRGKNGLTTQENECEKGKLRLRKDRRSLPGARPVPVQMDLVEADVSATKWVTPSGLSAPPSAGPQVSRRGPGWRPVLRSARWQGQATLPQLGP